MSQGSHQIDSNAVERGEPTQDQWELSSRGWVLTIFLILFIAWCIWATKVAYDFTNPLAKLKFRNDSQFLVDVFTRIPLGWHRVFSGATFLISAIGLGHLGIRPLRLRFQGTEERVLLKAGAGLIAWTWVTLALGSVDLLRAGPFRIVLALGLLVVAWESIKWARSTRACFQGKDDQGLEDRTSTLAHVLLKAAVWGGLALVLYIAFLGALGPEAQFDGRWYHLAQVKHYLQRGTLYNMVAETRITVTGLPAYHQMLLVAVAGSFSLEVAKLFPWFELLLTVGMIVCIGKFHFRNRLLGTVAALFFASTPLVSWFASTSGNDLAVILFSLYALHIFLRWRGEYSKNGNSWLIFLGLFCGYAAGIKPFALSFTGLLGLAVMAHIILFPHEIGSVAKRWRAAAIRGAIIGTSAVVAVTPWLLRSWATTGNPTFPFLDGVFFDSPYWNHTVTEYYHWAVRQYGVEPTLAWFLKLPLLTVTRADAHRALIGPLFLIFFPVLVLVAVKARGTGGRLYRFIAWYAGGLVTLWFAAGLHETRYVAFVLPLLAILVSFSLVEFRWRGKLGSLLGTAFTLTALGVTILNLNPFVVFHAHGCSRRVAGKTPIFWKTLYGKKPANLLEGNKFAMIRYLNHHLQPGQDKVFDGTGNLVRYYLYNDIELFNGGMWDSPPRLRQWNLESPDVLARLVGLGITHLVVDREDWPWSRLKGSPLGHFLNRVWEAPDGQVLYRLNPEADHLHRVNQMELGPASMTSSVGRVFCDGFEQESTESWDQTAR